MAKYIDADKVIEQLKAYRFIEDTHYYKGVQTGIAVAIGAVEAAGPIDAEKVVRCADCKFYPNHTVKDVLFDEDACHWNQDEQPDPWDFCSAGERREEE